MVIDPLVAEAKRLRERYLITQRKFASLCGIDVARVSKLESGSVARPSEYERGEYERVLKQWRRSPPAVGTQMCGQWNSARDARNAAQARGER